MRTLRIAIVGALVGALQLPAPFAARAQVDPCSPVPIPELCDTITDQLPILPSPSPSPDAPDGNDKTKKKKKAKPDQGEDVAPVTEPGEKQRKRVDDEDPPFVLGGPKNTARLLKILTRLAELGVPVERALMQVVGPFPVAGLAWWTDDWGACRDGCARSHKGLDIFAETGTPLVAAADGVVTQKGIGALPGLYVEIEDANGIQYFYAHMDSWADVEIGQPVRMGQVLGTVGNTGNAISTPPHVHFEFQPGGVPEPPKPWVDEWLKIAEERALELLNQRSGEQPITLEELDAFRLTRLLDLAGVGAENGEPSSRLLLLAGLQPAASSLEFARRALDELAWEIDWTDQVDAQLAELFEAYEDLGGGETPEVPFLAPTPEVVATEPDSLDLVPELGD